MGWIVKDTFSLWRAEALEFSRLVAAVVNPLSGVSFFGLSISMAFLKRFLVVLSLTHRTQRTTECMTANVTNPNIAVTMVQQGTHSFMGV